MKKILYFSVLVFTFLFILLLSETVHAAGNPNAPILFVNLNANQVGGVELPAVLLTPAGYKNVKTVKTIVELLVELQNMKNYSVLILSYHSLRDSAELGAALTAAMASIEAWVKVGGVGISTMGRDAEEQPLVNLFQLKVADPGTGAEAIISIEPTFAKDIAGGKVDASASSDNTPNNGQIYVDPLPSWAIVVAKNAAGKPISVAGRYGLGAIWAAAGFEITNIGTGIDADQSMFKGFKQLWKNMMDWLTTPPATAVDREGKLATTWASIKN